MKWISFSLLLLCACGGPRAQVTGNEGPHGGDPLQFVFRQAQTRAVSQMRNWRECALRFGAETGAAQWLKQNHRAFLEDLKASPMEWTNAAQASCAQTDLRPHATVSLSYANCGDLSVERATQLLFHESVHHFGIADEDFATQVAVEASGLSAGNCEPALDEIEWLDADVRAWPSSTALRRVSVETNQICFDFEPARDWPSIAPDHSYLTRGNYWVVAYLGDRWVASTYEWIPPQNFCEAETAVSLANGTGQPSFKNWVPRHGELVGFMVSSVVRRGFSNGVQERSPIFWLRWP